MLVAEILGNGQTGQGNPHPGAGRLIHLPENEAGFIDNAALAHFDQKVFPFTGPFTDAGKNRIPAVFISDVTNEFLDQHGFPNAGTTKEADFPPFNVGAEQIDNFNAGFQNFFGRVLLNVGRCAPVNGPAGL